MKEFTLDYWQRQEVILSSKASRLALETTQPPIQWVLEAKRTVGEADHRPPASRLRMCGATLPFLHVPMAFKETDLPLP